MSKKNSTERASTRKKLKGATALTPAALHEKAMLISVSGKVFRGTLKDAMATTGLADLYETTPQYVMASKRILPKELLDAPRKIMGQVRNYLMGKSAGALDGKFLVGGLPQWGDGWYILPNALNEQVCANVGEAISKFKASIVVFKDQCPDGMTQIEQDNPKLYNIADYGLGASATKREVAEHLAENGFDIQRRLTTIPDSGDIRVEVSKAQRDALQSDMDSKTKEAATDLAEGNVDRIIGVMQRVSKQLNAYDPDDKGKAPFRDTLIDQLRDLSVVARALNIHGDTIIDNAISDALAAIGNYSADILRDDSEVRADVSSKLSKVAKDLKTAKKMDKLFAA